MATVENLRESLGGYRLDLELKNVPIGFVNGLRRVALSEIPVVVLTNVQILDNNTQLTHEMIRHRVEMLPINVLPEETAVLRDTKVELRYLPPSAEAAREERIVTTDQFQIAGPRKDIILKDRDLEEPLYFMTLAPNESLHIRASLGIDPRGSHVSVSTFSNHIDPDLAKVDKDTWIAEGGDPKVFDNFHIQRSYARDENGRPYWFNLAIESVGVLTARDILKRSVEVIQNKIAEWVKTPILRHGEGWFSMETEGETFTLGQLVQELMYSGGLAEFVSRDLGHPLLPKLYIRFSTKLQPEAVVERVRVEALALCESILKSV
jgi:DNA-directed RNA polymerase subunit L